MAVTVVTTDATTINGEATLVLDVQYEKTVLVFTGTEWAILVGGEGDGVGIEFDTSPQSGDYLEVTAVGGDPVDAFGVKFEVGEGGMLVNANAGNPTQALVVENADGAGALAIGVQTDVATSDVDPDSKAIGVAGSGWADDGIGVGVEASGGSDAGTAIGLDAYAVSAGDVFPIRGWANATKVFEVDADGNIHVPEGSSVIDDIGGGPTPTGDFIPQGGPLTEDFYVGNGYAFRGADGGAGLGGERLEFYSGEGNEASGSAAGMTMQGGSSSGDGGGFGMEAGWGGAGGQGGDFELTGGAGDTGNSEGTSIRIGGGAADGVTHGKLTVKTDASWGAAGEGLVSDGSENVVWGPVASGDFIPQGGPLTADLDVGGFAVRGADGAAAPGGGVVVIGGTGDTADAGGNVELIGGTGDAGNDQGAEIALYGGVGDGNPGRASLTTDGSLGASGQALVSDGSSQLVYGGVISAAGVPSGAPDGSLPFAYDTTAITGGFYFWNGSSWVKIATIL